MYAGARRRTLGTVGALVALTLGLSLPTWLAATSARASQTFTTSGSTITVSARGNGHGHGLSQYGAQGAALAGLTTAQILAFYYPGTAPKTIPASTLLRVQLSDAGADTCVLAKAGLSASGYGALPTAGITHWRLIPSGSGLALQSGTGAGCANAGWKTVSGALPTQVDFSSSQGYVRLLGADGTSTDYRGTVGAVRSGSGELTINRVPLDSYAMGVAPREMPASWRPAAVAAQAVAARTYAEYEREHAGVAAYDICDDDDCQVYGGMTHYSATGQVLWSDDPAAVSGNAGEVLTYGGAAAFTQYSASNGGATAAGGQPYLVGKLDPYDDAASGDPYLAISKSVSNASVAAYFGLSSIRDIVVTARDGIGPFGGRITAGYVDGTAGSTARQVTTTGFGLQAAFGLGTSLLNFAQQVPGAPLALKVTATSDRAADLSWSAPSSAGSAPVTGYRISSGPVIFTVAASVHSTWVTQLPAGAATTITVQAINAAGIGAAATVGVTPGAAAPATVHIVAPARLMDTRVGGRPVTATAPLYYGVPGHGSIPTGAASSAVQLAVTIIAPTASGLLRVYPYHGLSGGTAAIAYRAGVTSTVTVNVPFNPTAMLVFVPSAGSMNLILDQIGYSGPGGQALAALPASQVLAASSVPSGSGSATIAITGRAGVPAGATAAVLSVTATSTTTPGWLRFWAAGAAVPGVSQVSAPAHGSATNLVTVPLGAGGAIAYQGSSAAIGASVSLVGYAAPVDATLTSQGPLESMSVTGLADTGTRIGTSAHVTTTPVSVKVAGVDSIPASGVPAVLLQVSAAASSTGGSLYVFSGPTRPSDPVLQIPTSGSVTTTVLVPLPAAGTITMVGTAATTVAVDVLGYVVG